MQLSKRLTKLADLVTAGNRLTDVGTDHGYVPIYLLEKKQIPSAIAMDINQGPLERAREHIRQYGYEPYIETRLSDGLCALKAGEADTVLIAGMGGALMVRILEEGAKVLETVQELILQPQSELYQMRKFLWERKFTILSEHMVYEDGKYYPMMRVCPGKSADAPRSAEESLGENAAYTETEYYFGKVCLQQDLDVLMAYLEKSLMVQGQILQNLKKTQGEKGKLRRREVEELIRHLEICQKQIYGERIERKERKERKGESG